MTVSSSLRGTYTYNGLEQLSVRVLTNMTPSGTTHFVHDRKGNVIAETDGSGAAGTQREYIWLPDAEIAPTFGSRAQIDRPVAVVDQVSTSPVLYWVHVDQLSRPIRMTDGSKAQLWDAAWAPWGSPHLITGAAALDARFPGQWFQLESGLHYNWHRHYDPSLGRYTQPDPLGFVDGPSVYAYAETNPIVFVDKDGREVLVCQRPTRFTGPAKIINSIASHAWIKTDTVEAGMGAAPGNIPGDNSNWDLPGSRTQIIDHSGQSKQSGAQCSPQVRVNEECVNRLLKLGQPTGRFWPLYNDCQSLAKSIIQQCRE